VTLVKVWIGHCDAVVAHGLTCGSVTEVTGGDRSIVTARRRLMGLGWAINDDGLVLCPRHVDWTPAPPPAA
jgi:hypothetical protein